MNFDVQVFHPLTLLPTVKTSTIAFTVSVDSLFVIFVILRWVTKILVRTTRVIGLEKFRFDVERSLPSVSLNQVNGEVICHPLTLVETCLPTIQFVDPIRTLNFVVESRIIDVGVIHHNHHEATIGKETTGSAYDSMLGRTIAKILPSVGLDDVITKTVFAFGNLDDYIAALVDSPKRTRTNALESFRFQMLLKNIHLI
jgi:hypothetical protein